MLTGYQLRLGDFAASEMGNAYDVGSFERQADMPALLDWLVINENDTFNRYAQLDENFDRGFIGQGGASFVWPIPMTPLMVQYFRETYFGATGPFDGQEYAYVTARHLDADYWGDWVVVNATMRWAPPPHERIGAGLKLYVVQFVEATEAPATP